MKIVVNRCFECGSILASRIALDALQTALPGNNRVGLFALGVRTLTDRIYEDILSYLREEYPDKTEDELEELADIIEKAWLDGIF